MPTLRGKNISLRILYSSSLMDDVNSLGFPPYVLDSVKRAILGILTSSLGVFLIAFMIGESWMIVGTIMATSLFMILACILTIRDVERTTTNIEGLRSKDEHYCYLNRVQMIKLKQLI